MNDFFELVIIVVIAVVGISIIYKFLPFKIWDNNRPSFALFPKYVADFDKPVSEVERILKKNEFKKSDSRLFTRGSIGGDFSINALKLAVSIDEDNQQVKVYSSFFGVLFDTGDIWQLTSDIVKG